MIDLGKADRRERDVGPPPGRSDRRLRYDGRINLGAIVQALTVAGSVAAGIFYAGAWVQEVRDDMRAAQTARQGDFEQMARLIQLLKDSNSKP